MMIKTVYNLSLNSYSIMLSSIVNTFYGTLIKINKTRI